MADDFPLNAAISAVKRGLSANEGLRQYLQAGGHVRRQDWLALVREVRGTLETRATGIGRQGDRKPTRSEIFVMTTVLETGYMQHVDIWVKDRETGEIGIRPYSIRTDDLLTHDDAIETALDRMAVHAENYNETILGGSYLGTYILIPKRP